MEEKNELEIKASKDKQGNIKLAAELAHTFDKNTSLSIEADNDKNVSAVFKTKF